MEKGQWFKSKIFYNNKQLGAFTYRLMKGVCVCMSKHGGVVLFVKNQALCTTNLVEVVSYDLPNARPLQPDTVHVVVGDFYNFLETKHPWLM